MRWIPYPQTQGRVIAQKPRSRDPQIIEQDAVEETALGEDKEAELKVRADCTGEKEFGRGNIKN